MRRIRKEKIIFIEPMYIFNTELLQFFAFTKNNNFQQEKRDLFLCEEKEMNHTTVSELIWIRWLETIAKLDPTMCPMLCRPLTSCVTL